LERSRFWWKICGSVLTQWKKIAKKTVWTSALFVNSELKIQCHVFENILLQTAFWVIWPTGYCQYHHFLENLNRVQALWKFLKCEDCDCDFTRSNWEKFEEIFNKIGKKLELSHSQIPNPLRISVKAVFWLSTIVNNLDKFFTFEERSLNWFCRRRLLPTCYGWKKNSFQFNAVTKNKECI